MIIEDIKSGIDKIISGCNDIKKGIDDAENLMNILGVTNVLNASKISPLKLTEVQNKLSNLESENSPNTSEIVKTDFAINPRYNDSTLSDDIKDIKQALESEKWPLAANPHLICDMSSPEAQKDRARGIIDLLIGENIGPINDTPAKKFLDFGCGDGYSALIAAEDDAVISVGYDAFVSPHWDKIMNPQDSWNNWKKEKGNLVLTNEISAVNANAPYDIILLYDVIDHSVNEDPVELMKKIHQVLKPEGKVYVRCHPFTSRHATHLYTKINKAYIHLVFTDEELKEMFGETGLPTRRIIHPIANYNTIFEKSGFKKVEERILRDEIEDFFRMPAISKRIIKNLGVKELPEFQMRQMFHDVSLQKQ